MSGSNRISRRRFLFAAGTSGVAATAVVATRNLGAPAQPEKAKAPPAGSGYRVTEHVRNYYRTTKV